MDKKVVGGVFFWNAVALVLLTLILNRCFGMSLSASELTDAAIERTHQNVMYTSQYVDISYPNGDVPDSTGVCTDVIIRSYRAVGIDLQQLIHEDMEKNFDLYPSKEIWGMTKPDSNIDHRRIPNLQTFFKRYGIILDISDNRNDYHPGDIVVWGGFRNGSSPWHIGIVTDIQCWVTGNPFVVHNIGYGPEMEDILFDFPIIGHYQYYPEVEDE
jgi:uncharacterized protein YijF (DUF1287 family)